MIVCPHGADHCDCRQVSALTNGNINWLVTGAPFIIIATVVVSIAAVVVSITAVVVVTPVVVTSERGRRDKEADLEQRRSEKVRD
ncbi:MAG: hypothetical protein SGPRY_008457 [Prymnesium sp.]